MNCALCGKYSDALTFTQPFVACPVCGVLYFNGEMGNPTLQRDCTIAGHKFNTPGRYCVRHGCVKKKPANWKPTVVCVTCESTPCKDWCPLGGKIRAAPPVEAVDSSKRCSTPNCAGYCGHAGECFDSHGGHILIVGAHVPAPVKLPGLDPVNHPRHYTSAHDCTCPTYRMPHTVVCAKCEAPRGTPCKDWCTFSIHTKPRDPVVADPVNHPRHYTSDPSGVECITITRHRNFAIGSAIKYLWRAGLKTESGKDDKTKQIEDLKKAVWYIQDEIKRIEGGEKP